MSFWGYKEYVLHMRPLGGSTSVFLALLGMQFSFGAGGLGGVVLGRVQDLGIRAWGYRGERELGGQFSKIAQQSS